MLSLSQLRVRTARRLDPGATQEWSGLVNQLIRSRRVIVDAYEIERRRIERDLHDGAQQHLTVAAMALGEAWCLAEESGDDTMLEVLEQARTAIDMSIANIRRTIRGIAPHALADLGLQAAVSDMVSKLPGCITLHCPRPLPNLPEGVAAAAYFFVSEALTNATKYAPHSPVSVVLTACDELHISVLDEGEGGARFVPGGGLEGMRERLAAFGGSVELTSPPGGPTRVLASLPLLLYPGESTIGLENREKIS
ncbi:MAG: histidine kinase [Actinomycetaceae bacterium]|nr:histidine kinase [Actinomycetaceae bacterium]